MKKIYTLPVLFIAVGSFVYGLTAKAVCPVCTVAVGVGIGLSRWLGIDDRITGLWVGGLMVSLSAWTIDYLNKKQIKFFGRKPLIVAGWYAITILPLYGMGIMGHPYNKFCGMDKILFGVIVGTIIFIIANLFHAYLKKANNNKSYFPYQKVAIPVSFLLLTSVILYIIFTCE